MSLVRYDLEFPDGHRWHHEIALSVEPLSLPEDLPDWTRLDFHRCKHCPLDPAGHDRCPLAAALVGPAHAFAGIPSWTPVAVRVTTSVREIAVNTTLQRAVGSMIGLLSALSGCPHTRPMLPMAMFHLPFSTPEETLLRVAGVYLFGQNLRLRSGLAPDWEMRGLVDVYANLRIVNSELAARIRSAADRESTANAVVLLDVLAADMRSSLEETEGNELADMFVAYLQKGDNVAP